MEDNEDSLELSLGLAYGGSSNKSKPTSSSDHSGGAAKNHSSNGKHIHDGLGILNVSDASFDGFFTSNNDNQNRSEVGQERRENFWTSLGNNSSTQQNAGASGPMYRELLASPDNNKPGVNIVDEKSVSVLDKRKMSFNDITAQKKLNQEDSSNRENEDVTESEADGPPSWLIHRTEENNNFRPTKANARYFVGNPGQLGKSSHGSGVPFSIRPASSTSSGVPVVPVVDVQNSSGRSAPTFPPHHPVFQMMPLSKDKQQPTLRPPPLNGNQQVAFGYSSVQLPTLERGSWMLGSPFQSGTSRIDRSTMAQPAPPLTPGENLKTSHATGVSTAFESRKIMDLTKENGKEVIIVEEVLKHPTSQTKDGSINNNKIFRQNEIPKNQPTDSNIIRPGVAPGLKFGGNGSCPDLPWVSTTGPGPNGKTISGVTYKYSKTQIKIVCACHGSHMSPEEFVLHANADDAPDVENNPGRKAASSHS